MLVGTRHTKIVRRAFDLFEAGQVGNLVALYHPDVEIRVTGVLHPPAQTYAGVECVRGYLQGLVDEGKNCRVEGLELVEIGHDVLAQGWMAAPANLDMRWHFDFEGDLIARVIPLEGDWAVLGGRGFAVGQVAAAPGSGRVELRLSDGRSLIAPIAGALEPRVAVHDPVLAYFDGHRLAGWYLPDRQLGMDLR